MSLIRMKMD